MILLNATALLQAQSAWMWTNTVSGAWATAANWDLGTVPNASDVVVVFSNSPPAINTTNVISGGTNSPFVFGTLVSSNGVVLNGGGQLTAQVSLGTPVIAVGSGSLWLYPLLGGTQGFNKTGAGELTFRYNLNDNPLTGNIIISGGDLCLNLDGNLGNTNNDLTISNNAKLLINPTTLAPLTLAPSRTLTLACTSANIDVAGTNWLTIPGIITESSPGQGLQKTDPGTLALAGANSYSGTTTINGGLVKYQANGGLGGSSAIVNASGELACDANLVLTNPVTLSGGTISFNGNNGAFTGPVTLDDNSTVAMRAFGNSSAANGSVINVISGATNTLTVAGGGNLTLACAGGTSVLKMLRVTAGSITIASGALNIATGSSPGNTVVGGGGFNVFNGSAFTNNGGTLNLSGNYFTPAGNGSGGNNYFTLQNGSIINNGGEVLLAYAANGTLTINGGTFNNQAQSIRVSQAGTGVVNLNGGTLALAQFSVSGNPGTVNFNGGTLRANVDGATLIPAFNANVVKTGGAVIDSQNYSVTAAAPLLSGSSPDGGLKKLGDGTLTLTATNTYNGPTTIVKGTLALGVKGLLAGTSGLVMSNNTTLLLALDAPSGPTNIVVNGSITLAGHINLSDAGIVANGVYPIISYTGSLTDNGVTAAAQSPWAFTIDTSMAHLVRLLVGQKYPLLQMTNADSVVSTTTTNLGGVLHGTPALPLWYEVRDQTNRLWDYGATPAVSPWSITVRHLREGMNSVTVFAKDSLGNISSNRVQLTLTLGQEPSVRPRPQPAEIWWGGSCHDNLYSGGAIVGTYSRMSQLVQTNGWDFVKHYADGFFLHGYVWVNTAARMTNWQSVGASISAQLAPFNGKYWLEDSWQPPTNNMNYGHSSASGQASDGDDLLGVGFALSEITQDFNPKWGEFSQWHPDWPTNNIRVLVTGNTNLATAAYPYASGLWRDYANDFHATRPNIRFGWTWSPVWFHWLNGRSLGADSGVFTVSSGGTNYSFNWDFYDWMNDAVAIGNQAGEPFSFSSDCPWEYYSQNPGNPGGWSEATQLANRLKIRNYEAWLQNQNLRHTLICNSQTMNATDTNASDLAYEAHSMNVMYLHQQEGGRASRYSFESWYQGPYTLLPETKAGSYTHLALTAIKYLKGIADTNGGLEQLNFMPLATNGTVLQLQLQNNGDVPCLPAIAGQPGNVPGVFTRYFATNGAELSATILTAEGFCYTNLLQPGARTNLFAVTLANNLSAATNENASLEAFWNPQDPLGIVRDRQSFSNLLNPLGLWQDTEIGNVGVTGGSALSGTNFIVLGSGADIGGNADACHFVYQPHDGDGILTARVTSQTAADVWSKAGVMVRENTSAGAREAFVCLTPNNSVNFQNRPVTSGASFTTGSSGFTAPYWVRLARSGTTFTALCSSNGVNWVTLGSSNVTSFSSSALWGLAVTAHNTTLASAATFDNVVLPNVAPTLNPIADRTLVAGQTLILTNSASDADVPKQILMFALVSAPSGVTLNATNGILTWRPTLVQSPSTNTIRVQVFDNGSPSLSATQSFQVVVLQPVAPALGAAMVNGHFVLTVTGDSGPDYIVQATTNLVQPLWLGIYTNVAGITPFQFTDPDIHFSRRFYRVGLSP